MTTSTLTNTAELFGVQGLVVVITGGATGIGLMMATALENNGAIVYIVGRRADALEKAIRERNKHGNIIPIQGDISSTDSLKVLAETVKQRHGYINLLVNNAGVIIASQPKLPTLADAHDDITTVQDFLWNYETPESFEKTFDINVAGVWFCTVAFLELLHEGNKRSLGTGGSGVSSQVVTISSSGGFRKDSVLPSLSYVLSKGAATHLGRMMAHYFKDWKIRSNVICPGVFPSELVDATFSEENLRQLIGGVPLQRMGTTDDMAGLILFLTSKAGSYVDGAVHIIDGGKLVSQPTTS